jgi:hypothetical protein
MPAAHGEGPIEPIVYDPASAARDGRIIVGGED